MNEILRFMKKYDSHTREITTWFHDRIRLEVIRTTLELIRKRLEVIKTRLEVIRTRQDVNRTSPFLGGQSHGRDQELDRVSEISNLFDILPTQHGKLGNYN